MAVPCGWLPDPERRELEAEKRRQLRILGDLETRLGDLEARIAELERQAGDDSASPER